MSEPQAFVKNAADAGQVRDAGKKERFARRNELDDLRFVLGYPQGRRFIWRLLTYCSVFKSIWRASAEIHHLSGKQDCGHWVMGEITEADEEKFALMMKEAKQQENLQ